MTEKIGVIGGSGFGSLLDNAEEVRVNTPYGAPSSKLLVGKVGRQEVVFLPRHGNEHQLPPHKIPYRANIYALKELGIGKIITATAVGSVQKKIKPGDFVIIDQFVNWTKNRADTFYDGPITAHISTAFPYCGQLNRHAYKTAKKLKIKSHLGGAIVVIEGPRFSTAAESLFFTKMGWDIVNMTQYPEVALAREMGLCYCALALVTDYDAGVIKKEGLKPVSTKEVIKVFGENNQQAAKLITKMISELPKKTTCDCRKVLENAAI